MEIPALNNTRTISAQQTDATQSDYQTFLTMLTVQMQNQDPLNPASASDFAVQLATFAGVEQQSYTNQLLSRMMGETGMADLGRWIGMEALTRANAVFEGDPIPLAIEPLDGADSLVLTARDAAGVIVDTRHLQAGTTQHQWDGLNQNGERLPNGAYTFELESRRGEETLGAAPVASFARIVEVRQDGTDVALRLTGNRQINPDDVIGLRAATGP